MYINMIQIKERLSLNQIEINLKPGFLKYFKPKSVSIQIN